jgi:putative tryptophan/tyrosine transport system substrate-binding protein
VAARGARAAAQQDLAHRDLDTTSADLNKHNVSALLDGLRERGYTTSDNLIVDYKSSNGNNALLSDYAAELVHLRPDAIVVRGTPQVLAVMQATGTIPIVMAAIADPVGAHVVRGLSRPGGNVTGLSSFHTELEAKRLEVLLALAPSVREIVTLRDFSNPTTALQWEQLVAASKSLNIEVKRMDVRTRNDIETAFQKISNEAIRALDVGIDTVTATNRKYIVEMAASHQLPAIYAAREFVEIGGLASYGVNYPDLYYRAAAYLDKIFKGAKPADLPVEQPTKFELVINLKTANALGLAIPASLLATADEVIE